MENIKKIKTKPIGYKSDLIFYCLLLVVPVIQFCIFYIAVNFNSFLLAFKEITLTGEGEWSIKWSLNAWSEVWGKVTIEKILRMTGYSFLSFAISISIGTPLGLLFSYYIAKKHPGAGVFRVILYLPSILSAIVMVMLFKYFVDNAIPQIAAELTPNGFDAGGESTYLSLLNQSPTTQYFVVIFYCLWVGFGVNVLMYANAMSGIAPEITEAAYLDGATGFKEFWYISLPLVYPTLSVFLITGIAGVFTNQYNMYTFFAGQETDFMVFGYYLYKETQKISTKTYDSNYPWLSVFGLLMTFVAVPLTFLVRYLLEKFGPSED